MFGYPQQIRVLLRFAGMDSPVEISVPPDVLRYLDRNADRTLAADGTVIYERVDREAFLRCRTGQPCVAV